MAAHLAHTGLLAQEAHAAVAGGTNAMLDATTMAGICQLQVGVGVAPEHAHDRRLPSRKLAR